MTNTPYFNEYLKIKKLKEEVETNSGVIPIGSRWVSRSSFPYIPNKIFEVENLDKFMVSSMTRSLSQFKQYIQYNVIIPTIAITNDSNT